MGTAPYQGPIRKDLGLALGGGGLRGAAHIGVLKVLAAEGLLPGIVVGTSAGSIVAGLYASGLTPEEMEALALSVTPQDVWDPTLSQPLLLILGLTGFLPFSDTPFSARWIPRLPMGLLQGKKLEQLLHQATRGKTFNHLQQPTAIVATDLNTGREVIFCSRAVKDRLAGQLPDRDFYTEQTLAAAIRASTAIPGIFVPKQIRSRQLIDGGLKNNVPASLAKAWGARVILAVDLEFASQRNDRISNFLEVLIQSSDIMGQTITDLHLSHTADLVIRPGIYEMGLLDMKKIPMAISRGVAVTKAVLPQIKDLLR